MYGEVMSPNTANRPTRRGWVARFLGAWLPAGPNPTRPRHPRTTGPASRRRDGLRKLTRHLVAADRYVFVLLAEASGDISETDAARSWKALDEQMALVPTGTVPVLCAHGAIEPVSIEAFYIDRCAVSNLQYQRFIAAKGYDELELWPREVWPSLMRFVDQTGKPGPRDWADGRFPHGKADHPVTGVCWHEAMAFASWVGKRLPTAAEWQKAAGWPEDLAGGMGNRYPWGDVFAPDRANLWSSGVGGTVAVKSYLQGATPNGLLQLSGNVWHWLADPLDTLPCAPNEALVPWQPMRRIIGGAFNTYFPNEATNYFVTGQPELDRRSNIGFRCVVSTGRLRPRP